MKSEWSNLEARYWKGESTLEEENELRKAALRSEPGISNELIAAFQAIDSAGERVLDQDFEDAFWDKIDSRSNGGQSTGLVFTLASFVRYAAAAALFIALGLTVAYLLKGEEEKPQVSHLEYSEEDTFSDPEEAFRTAMDALGMASEKLNEGKQPVKEIKRFYQTKTAITGMGTAPKSKD